MGGLAQMKCSRPRSGGPPLSDERIAELHSQVPDWQIVEREGIKQLERTFKFKNFVEALQFTNQVGELAEEEDHHPALLTEWGKVTVTWWTHAVKGLHLNDFIAAAKADQTYT
ncbi:MAG: 4a-hydroxytetrahydrobiopterin dehydratase [Anaerolineales bacterium]|nr:MAG: 4a-hydroxytetrahydrobiopterin dehydratase [Anaerolineales bacterium]